MKNYLFCAVLLLLISCDKNPTKIEKEKSLRHADLTQLRWTVDTLYTENSLNTVMYSIWGASENDVWVGGSNDNFWGERWHYDGEKWTADWYGGIPSLEIYDIWGFAADDIWAVGERRRSASPLDPNYNDRLALIMHYDGSEWQEVPIPENDVHVGLSSIGGAGPNELFAGGVNGTLYHYDGVSWQLDSLAVPEMPNDSGTTHIPAITHGNSGDDIFLLFNWYERYAVLPSVCLLYKRENDKWVLKDTAPWNMYLVVMWMSPQKKLYLLHSHIVTWEEGVGFTSLPNVPDALWNAVGGWDDNLLVCGRSHDASTGLLYHFDGQEWRRFYNLPLNGVWCWEPFFVDDVVFLRASNIDEYPIKSYIFKGTLSN